MKGRMPSKVFSCNPSFDSSAGVCVCVSVCSKLTGAGGGRQPHPPEMMHVTGGGD